MGSPLRANFVNLLEKSLIEIVNFVDRLEKGLIEIANFVDLLDEGLIQIIVMLIKRFLCIFRHSFILC